MRLSVIRMKQPDCPVVELSRYVPNVEVYIMDSRLVDNYLRVVALIKHVGTHRKLINKALIKSGATSVNFIITSGSNSLVEIRCPPTNAFLCMRSKSLMFKPLVARGGSEDWLLLTPNKGITQEILRELKVINDVEVINELSLKLKEAPILATLTTPNSLIKLINLIKTSLLTEQQEVVLSKAVSMGYYRCPRSVGLDELAKELGTSKAGVTKVLRRAERKAADFILNLTKLIRSSIGG